MKSNDTKELIVLQELQGNAPVELNAFQRALEPYTEGLAFFWMATWCITALFLVVHVLRHGEKAE